VKNHNFEDANHHKSCRYNTNINQPFAFQFVNNYRTGFIHPTVSLTFDTLQQQQQQQEQANMCEPSPQSKIKP